jgi:hypothetical protein
MSSDTRHETDGWDRSGFVPPLFQSTRGLLAYYAVVLPIAGTAAYWMVEGDLQAASYLVVGLVAALSLSYTAWLVRTRILSSSSEGTASPGRSPSSTRPVSSSADSSTDSSGLPQPS